MMVKLAARDDQEDGNEQQKPSPDIGMPESDQSTPASSTMREDIHCG